MTQFEETFCANITISITKYRKASENIINLEKLKLLLPSRNNIIRASAKVSTSLMLDVEEILSNIDRKTLSRNLKKLDINTKIISKEKFILISQQIHNNKYDYSLVHNFNNVKEKVKIICPIHGEFEQDIFTEEPVKVCRKCDVEKGR